MGDRPRCAHPGCITILSRDTIDHGWDMCATHRAEESRRELEALLAGEERRERIAAAAEARRRGISTYRLLYRELGETMANQHSKRWQYGDTIVRATAETIVRVVGLDPAVLDRMRPVLRSDSLVPSAALVAAVDAAAAAEGVPAAELVATRCGRNIRRQLRRWRRGAAVKYGTLLLVCETLGVDPRAVCGGDAGEEAA